MEEANAKKQGYDEVRKRMFIYYITYFVTTRNSYYNEYEATWKNTYQNNVRKEILSILWLLL